MAMKPGPDVVVGRPGARVGVQHQAELLDGRPHRLVDGVVVGGLVEPAGRDHHAAEARGRRRRGSRPPRRRCRATIGTTATPMRRSGSLAQKSASHRLWARAPARTSSGSLSRRLRQAGAERRRGDPAGAEHVGVGEEHLGGHALAVEHLVAGVGVVGGDAGRRRRSWPPTPCGTSWRRRLLASRSARMLGLVVVEALAVRGVEVARGRARPAGRRGRRPRSAGSGRRVTSVLGSVGSTASGPSRGRAGGPSRRPRPGARRVSPIDSRSIMKMKSSARMPSTTMRASSLRSCQGSSKPPFSAMASSLATVIGSVVRGRSRASSAGRVRSDSHSPVRSRPPDG